VNFDKLKEMPSVAPQEFAEQVQRRTDDVNWILESMVSFEDKLEPYLKFHQL